MIGAGSSGITACKALSDRGLEFDCFELGSEVGGNWRYGNDNEMSSAYASLHINTSREQMQYEDFPMPEDYPDYADHARLARYFDAYVDEFGLRDRITFRTRVERVEPGEGGGWSVTVAGRDGSDRRVLAYESVVVANGHHWDPRWPEPPFPGSDVFEGEQMHSHYYKEPDAVDGRRVLIVGIGNSACDIAVEASRIAEHTAMSIRTGTHVLPKYIRGKPTDALSGELTGRAPLWLQRLYMGLELRLAVGDVTDYGLPEPGHKLLSQHPTVSSELLPRIGHGDISVRPNIERLTERGVRFENGVEEEYDLIVYATGYRISFPFLDNEVFESRDNEMNLYRLLVPPDLPGLYFLGFIQPLGAIMPLVEVQSRWVADLIAGRAKLPHRRLMRLSIARRRRKMARRYARSKRHTVQVDFYPYLHEIRAEHRRGLRRAGSRPGLRRAAGLPGPHGADYLPGRGEDRGEDAADRRVAA